MVFQLKIVDSGVLVNPLCSEYNEKIAEDISPPYIKWIKNIISIFLLMWLNWCYSYVVVFSILVTNVVA